MDSLSDILTQAGVQATFSDKLLEDGWTAEHFAPCAPNLERLDIELKDMLGDLYDITTAQQRSALRWPGHLVKAPHLHHLQYHHHQQFQRLRPHLHQQAGQRLSHRN